MATSTDGSRAPAAPTMWERTKGYSNTAYEKALKPGFNKAYAVVDKLGKPVNRLSNKVGAEAFWPTTMDKESEKAARILRGFCKDGFYEQVDAKDAKRVESRESRLGVSQEGVPEGKQRVMVKIPTKVIQEAKALAIFTTMRTGWLLGGSGGAGVIVARHEETGEWSPPSGIQTQNLSFGFLAGIDIYDTVLVINTYKALEAFTKVRCTLGTEIGVAAGPVGLGGALDAEVRQRQSMTPIWSYVKSRGLYAGIALEGNLVIERTDENAKFYGYEITAQEIFSHKVRHPPVEQYEVLIDTLRAAQGDAVDESLLPAAGVAPSDMELDTEGNFPPGVVGAPVDMIQVQTSASLTQKTPTPLALRHSRLKVSSSAKLALINGPVLRPLNSNLRPLPQYMDNSLGRAWIAAL
jgi:lipid-binding SYLF domain-containing protein